MRNDGFEFGAPQLNDNFFSDHVGSRPEDVVGGRRPFHGPAARIESCVKETFLLGRSGGSCNITIIFITTLLI